jgi:hypothetical protein
MSVQTGQAVPEGPLSKRFTDRARFRWAVLWRDPNPIWIRELRQAARLTRTPLILMAVTIMITLVIAAVGGGVSATAPSDQVGMIVFHTFFSLAFFVVAWVGPALAANAIASEREGRTWEAVVLTGLRPQVIARGKFLAAYTSIGTYIVMIAPVGALPFLFGGVHPAEVMIAFAYLFIFALLSVAFGLAISSKMTNSRGAIVLTLLMAVPISFFVYGVGGPATAAAVHKLWDRVHESAPVWLPTAYVRGTMGPEYVVLLFGLPALAVVFPAWFLYEATVANLSGGNDDRSSGMKRWYLATALVLSATFAIAEVPIPYTGDLAFAVGSISGIFMFVLFGAFVFSGEPLAASRRVTFAWERSGAGPIRRFLGPGLVQAGQMQLAVALIAILAIAAVGYSELGAPPTGPYVFPVDPASLLRFAMYAAGYVVFMIGLATFLRARSQTSGAARVMLLVILAALAVVPWIVAAMVGAFSRGDDAALVMASPSPFYAFLLLNDRVDELVRTVGYIGAGTLAALGAFFQVSGQRRVKRIVGEFEARLAEAEQRLADEDAAMEEAFAAEGAAEDAASPASHQPAEHEGDAGSEPAAQVESGAAPAASDSPKPPETSGSAGPEGSSPPPVEGA